MASIINSIAFKNFFNYYGDYSDTQYDFEEGVNIIVADNGAGKSKFFNAFLWLFYDQILDSDDKQKKAIKQIAVKIISDKAKAETEINDFTEVGIRVEYSTGRHKYRITKSFQATRIAEPLTLESSWQINIDDIEVDKTELILTKFKPIYDEEEKLKIINQLILPNLRQYSFFQGEEVDSIIDFSKSSSIEDAVKTLTNISKYEDLYQILVDIAEKAEKDLNKQNNSSKDQSERLEIALKDKENLKDRLDKDLELLSQARETYEKAEDEKNTLEQNFANAEKRKDFDDKIKDKNATLRRVKEEYDRFLDGINSRFFDGNFAWIAYGFENEISDFSNRIKKFRETRQEKRTLQNVSEDPGKYFSLLPINSPDAVSLKNMIDDEMCYVCDREAKEGTEAHEYLLKLKNRGNTDSQEKEFVKNDLEDFFGGIQMGANPFCNKIDSIPQSVIQTSSRKDELAQRLDKLKTELKLLKSQRNDILISGSDPDSEDSVDALAVINQYKGSIRRMSDAGNRIERLTANINQYKASIKATDDELKTLRPKDIPIGYTENNDITRDLLEATEKAKERVYDNMISLLEKHANNHFQNLIAYNDLAGGILKFEKSPTDSISFNYLDKDGNLASGASTGFQRMKIFSVVMAIISANTTNYNYPLLADAPISEFGDGFIKGFFEETSKIFPQSIILAKELFDGEDDQKLSDLGKTLLNDKHIKTMYVNTVNKGAQQIDLVTNRMKLK